MKEPDATLAPAQNKKYRTVGYVVSAPENEEKVRCLHRLYDVVNVRDQDTAVDLLVVVGGDGFMLHSLHSYVINSGKDLPVYGVRCGTVGFLLNHCSGDDLPYKLECAIPAELSLLQMEAVDIHGHKHSAIAVNEVSVFRGTHQAAKLRIKINGKVVMKELISDGIMVASPAGSTAYNFSAGGPILPLNANVMSLTSINSFRPRRWRGALLPNDAVVELEALSPEERTVSVVADYTEFCNIKAIKISQHSSARVTLMFDPEHHLEERTIAEQFMV